MDSPYRPLAGSPDDLEREALHYQRIAEAIARSATTLKAISGAHEMRSDAVDALRDTAATVGADIDKARERYQKTAEALQTYSGELRQAQKDADTAIASISAREQERETAHRTLAHAQDAVTQATDAEKSTAQAAAGRAHHDAAAADAALGTAQQQWNDALAAKNRAAARAITAIVEVVDKKNNGLKDDWLDDWGNALFHIFKTICDWAAILSIFLAWVPGLGEVLLALAAIGAVLDLVMAMVKLSRGEGSWGDVALAAVGVVLTLAGGKLISLAAKGVKARVVLKAAPAIRAAGKDVRVEMRVLQKAQWGSEQYMSQQAARTAVREGARSFDSFANGAKTVRTAFKDSFTADVKAFKASGFRDYVGGKVYDLRHGLVMGSEVNQSLSIIKAYPELLRDPSVVKAMAGVTALQVGKVGTNVLHGLSAASSAEHDRIASGQLHDPVTTWLDRGFSVVKSVGLEPAAAPYDVPPAIQNGLKLPGDFAQVAHPAH